MFASLLDADKGGMCRIAPDRDDYVSKQLYLPDSAILITRFMTPDGVGEVHDFMPIAGGQATDRHRLVRNIKVVRGDHEVPDPDLAALQLRPDPAQAGGLRVRSGCSSTDDMDLSVHGIAPRGVTLRDLELTIEPDGRGLQWTRTLREGEIGGVVLESMGGLPQRLIPPDEAQALADDTARFWRGWLRRSTYTGAAGARW